MSNNSNLLSSIKNLGKFSFPAICNSLLNILPTLASIWILSRLGKDQLAAAGIATPTFFTILTIFLMGFYAVGIKIGHSFGKNKHSKQNNDEIGPWVINGLVIALILAIPAVLILLNIPSLLLLLGQKPHLVNLAKPFFYFGALAIIPMLVNSVFNQYFIGIGHPKVALYTSLSTFPLIVGLSYGLILGKWGLPRLEMGGINCASFIVDSLVMIAIIFIILFAKWSKKYNVFSRPLGINYKSCVELFHLGWPISIQVGGELAAMTAMAYLLGLFGASALAAAQIVQQYVLIFVMISMGLSQGVSVLISHAHGSNSLAEIKTITLAGCVLIGVISVVFAAGFLIFPHELIDIYLDINRSVHNQLVDLAIYFMMIAAIYIIFDGIRGVLTAALRGLQDSKTPMRIGVACLWLIGLPVAYIAGILLHGGPIALRFGFVSGVIVGTLLLFFININTHILRS